MKLDLVVSGYIIHEDKVLLIHHRKSGLWLPPGGHMDFQETPDRALKREIKEELNIDVDLLNMIPVSIKGNIKQQLANPFHVNIHSAGDHEHCCFFYVCLPKNLDAFKIDQGEIIDYCWHTMDDLSKKHVPIDVKNIGLKAFDVYNNYSKRK